jgi:hypothetical protein
MQLPKLRLQLRKNSVLHWIMPRLRTPFLVLRNNEHLLSVGNLLRKGTLEYSVKVFV